jgi:hypothetical protein
MKLELLTNATVVDDAIRFVSESEKSKDRDQVKSSSSSDSSNEDNNKEYKEPDYDDENSDKEGEEKQEQETLKSTYLLTSLSSVLELLLVREPPNPLRYQCFLVGPVK